jgi:TorA maturation chaperone TorD
VLANKLARAGQMAQYAEMRSQVYALLSHLYTVPPDQEFVKQMQDGGMAAAFSALLVEEMPEAIRDGVRQIQPYLSDCAKLPVDQVLEDLAVERTRLLRGVKRGYGPPPPYESVYRAEEDAGIWQTVAQIKRCYAVAGVGVPVESGEMADYIGLELDFLRYLAGKEAQAWRSGHEAEAEQWREHEEGFLRDHILTWVPRFCDLMREDATLGFYQGLAAVTKGFVLYDMV